MRLMLFNACSYNVRASTTSILQPMDQGVISTLKSYYLTTPFYKATAAINSDSSGMSGQSKFETFLESVRRSDAIMNIHDSWEEVKLSTLTGIWKKLISTLMGNFKGFKTSVEEVTENGKRTRSGT